MIAMAWALCAATWCAADPTTDSLATVKAALAAKTAVLVDVREAGEWRSGHLKDAKHLPLSKLKAGLARTELEKACPKGKVVYCHCAAGLRSCAAADKLKALGYDVRPLGQSYDDLLAAGFEAAQ
jgi:rhodanese-related sulfurtransferase